MSIETVQNRKAQDDDNNIPSDTNSLPNLNNKEREEVQDRVSISARVVHESIRLEGEQELQRTFIALICSSIAAGLSMGFSLVTMGILHAYLPNTPWRPLITSLGYSVGFVIVVLGRQQLFTENTVTVILPLLTHFNKDTFLRVLRLWSIVLLGNLVGTALFAAIVARIPVFTSALQESFTTLSQEALSGSFSELLLKSIFAGWLIALMVWLLPAAESTRLQIIIFITYIVGIAMFTHIIVDSIDAFYLVNTGKITFLSAIGEKLLPILIGNVIGGVLLVSVLNYGQVAGEKVKQQKK